MFTIQRFLSITHWSVNEMNENVSFDFLLNFICSNFLPVSSLFSCPRKVYRNCVNQHIHCRKKRNSFLSVWHVYHGGGKKGINFIGEGKNFSNFLLSVVCFILFTLLFSHRTIQLVVWRSLFARVTGNIHRIKTLYLRPSFAN